jgi:hypothetical protein
MYEVWNDPVNGINRRWQKARGFKVGSASKELDPHKGFAWQRGDEDRE